MNNDLNQIYQQHIQPSSADDQLQLIQKIAAGIAPQTSSPKQRRISEIIGLGENVWKGVDAQQYIDELRDEWDNRP